MFHLATKYTKRPQNVPNGHRIYQMAKHLRLQDPPKFSQIWDFWSENMPSGNRAFQVSTRDTR
jgi:hypothetical protein